MSPLIQKVLSDENFPSHPRVKIGEDKGKPIYSFFIPPEEFYQEGEKVFANYLNSDGKPMRYVFRFGKYNVDEWCKRHEKELTGDFEMLIVGTEFIR